MKSKSRPIYILGAGLYGCLTAWKIKNKKPDCEVVLVEPFGRLMKSFDPIRVGSLNSNNGFHAIELPRAARLAYFLEKKLNIRLAKAKAVKKLLLQEEIVDYTDKREDYPENIKSLFKREAGLATTDPNEFMRAVVPVYRKILKTVAYRYSLDLEEARHLLIPWFFPADYIFTGNDEGDVFRNRVRRGRLQASISTPKGGLFCRLQDPFLKALRKKGVVVKLNHLVKLTRNKIEIIEQKSGKGEDISGERIFFGHSPLSVLQKRGCKKNRTMFKNERHIIMALVKYFPGKRAMRFTEMLCCSGKFPSIARASRILTRGQKGAGHLLLELYTRPHQSRVEVKKQIRNFCRFAEKKIGYRRAWLASLIIGRKAFFPPAGDLRKALLRIKQWANKFPSVHVPDFIGPINMAKAWIFSEIASKKNEGRK